MTIRNEQVVCPKSEPYDTKPAMLFLGLFLINIPVATSDLLLVGDSHLAGPMGHALVKKIEEKGEHAWVDASCGATPARFVTGGSSSCAGTWQKLPGKTEIDTSQKTEAVPLDEAWYMLKAQGSDEPSQVVFVLGTNLASYCKDRPCYTSAFIEKQALRLLNTFQNKHGSTLVRCLWVGAPQARNIPIKQIRMVNSAIQKALGNRCEFFDSTQHTRYPSKGGDGLHYSGKAAEKWADDIFLTIRSRR